MNYTCITLHNEELNTIIDASIPNKSQNQAVKVQVNRACDVLMNRIAEGWLNEKAPEMDRSDNRDAFIKQMVDRFLVWTLPENFNPDAGISFKRSNHPMPTGTNLLDATQAEAMIRHITAGII